MKNKISNLEVLAEIHRRVKDKSVTPICKYLLSKSYESYETLKNLKKRAKAKINEEIKETKEVIDGLSFKTTFKDYKDALIELNFMPTYHRIHSNLEDSIFEEKNMRVRFGSLMAVSTELAVGMSIGMHGVPNRDIKPFLIYIGAKVLSHGSSAFYEYFRKIKQKLEDN